MELLGVGVPLVAAVSTIAAIGCLAANSESRDHYFIAAGAIAFTFNFTMPIRFKHGVATTLAVLVAFDVILALNAMTMENETGTASRQIHFAIFVTIVGLFGLVTQWRSEQTLRRDFLLRALQSSLMQALEDLTEQLSVLARTDPLTGLANRRHFEEVLDAEWEHACAQRGWLGFLIADIDHFKKLNDAAGHAAGDACLQQVAAAIKSQFTDQPGVVARFGGEEFVALIPGADPEAIIAVGEEFRATVERMNIAHPSLGNTRPVTVSVGVSTTIPSPAQRAQDILRAADLALYEAKENGRNVVFGRAAHPETALGDQSGSGGFTIEPRLDVAPSAAAGETGPSNRTALA